VLGPEYIHGASAAVVEGRMRGDDPLPVFRKAMRWSLVWVCAWSIGLASAQDLAHPLPIDDHYGGDHGMRGAHRLTAGIGHIHVSRGQVEGQTQWLAMGSWTLNYDHWITDRWAAGLQNDMILETFVVEHGDDELLERSYPVAVVPVAMYKPGKRFTFVAGAGAEVSHGHSIGLTRLGTEYGVHLPRNYEVGLALVWDNKWSYYNSWGITLCVSRIWPERDSLTEH
jgi:hypothetical protein